MKDKNNLTKRKLTKYEVNSCIKLLKKAKTYLRCDSTESALYTYICNALSEAEDELQTGTKQVLNRYIQNCLGDYETLEWWLVSQGFINSVFLSSGVKTEIQAYRHRWVDHMIYNLETKGELE